MKSFLLGLIFIFVYMIGYFLLSAIGLLWTDYHSIITSVEWFIFYTFVLGWWMAGSVCAEIYEDWEK